MYITLIESKLPNFDQFPPPFSIKELHLQRPAVSRLRACLQHLVEIAVVDPLDDIRRLASANGRGTLSIIKTHSKAQTIVDWGLARIRSFTFRVFAVKSCHFSKCHLKLVDTEGSPCCLKRVPTEPSTRKLCLGF